MNHLRVQNADIPKEYIQSSSIDSNGVSYIKGPTVLLKSISTPRNPFKCFLRQKKPFGNIFKNVFES